MTERQEGYRDRTLALTVIGVLLLLIGVAAAPFGPAEMYCFYLFSEGGRFHIEGFGFGSLVFNSIAWQIVGYYLIALLFIPLGYAHLRMRRWARPLMLSLLWSVWIVGAPLTVVFLVMLSFKELSSSAALFAVAGLGLAYLIVPGLLIRFYNSADVRQTFEVKDPKSYGIEKLPLPLLVLIVLLIFYIIVLHVPITFHGIFPLFGVWLSGLTGIVVLDACILSLVGLVWGVFKCQKWAWWGAVLFFSLLTLSSAVTLLQSSFPNIVAVMHFPPAEMEILENVPLQGGHLLPFVGLPLALTLVAILISRRHFGKNTDLTGAKE